MEPQLQNLITNLFSNHTAFGASSSTQFLPSILNKSFTPLITKTSAKCSVHFIFLFSSDMLFFYSATSLPFVFYHQYFTYFCLVQFGAWVLYISICKITQKSPKPG